MTNQLHPTGESSPEISSVLKVVLGSISEGVIVEDSEGKVIALNSKILSIFDLEEVPLEQFISKPIEHFEESSPRKIVSRQELFEGSSLEVRKSEGFTSETLKFLDGVEYVRHHFRINELGVVKGHLWLYEKATEGSMEKRVALESMFNLPMQSATNRTELHIWTRARLLQALAKEWNPNPNFMISIRISSMHQLVDTIGYLKVNSFINYLSTELDDAFIPGSVFRVYNDEFIFLAAEESVAHVSRKVEKIRASISSMKEILFDIKIILSATATRANFNIDNVEEMLNEARIALNAARHEGKEVVYSTHILTAEIRRDEIFAALPGAIHARDLSLYYQPIVDLASENTVGYESLSRWDHKFFGEVTAEEYIPYVRELNLLVALDKSNFDLLVSNSAIIARQKEIAFGLNISAQFLEPKMGLIETLEKFLQSFKGDPDQLVIELTESELVGNYRVAADTLHKVIEMGIKVAIDDFGIGNSSLLLLQKVPFNYIKLDKAFAEQCTDARTQSLILSVSKIAESFGAKTVAEGIEDRTQLQIMQDSGIDLGQGWFFGVPVPIQEINLRL